MNRVSRLVLAWVCNVGCGAWIMAYAVTGEPMQALLACTSGFAGALCLIPTEGDDV